MSLGHEHEGELVLDMAEQPWWIHARARREAEQARVRVPWLEAALAREDAPRSKSAPTPFGHTGNGRRARRSSAE